MTKQPTRSSDRNFRMELKLREYTWILKIFGYSGIQSRTLDEKLLPMLHFDPVMFLLHLFLMMGTKTIHVMAMISTPALASCIICRVYGSNWNNRQANCWLVWFIVVDLSMRQLYITMFLASLLHAKHQLHSNSNSSLCTCTFTLQTFATNFYTEDSFPVSCLVGSLKNIKHKSPWVVCPAKPTNFNLPEFFHQVHNYTCIYNEHAQYIDH